MTHEPPAILVTGDIILDHHLYEGARASSASLHDSGTLLAQTQGGAALLHGLLQEWQGQSGGVGDEAARLLWGVHATAWDHLPPHLHCFGLWRPFPAAAGGGDTVWRLAQPLGYGPRADGMYFPTADEAAIDQSARVVVLDDGALGLRFIGAASAWPRCLSQEREPPDWIVLKMAAPLAQGDLWRMIVRRHAGRTIAVVSINDVRAEAVHVAYGVSWERTAQDLVHELQNNVGLAPLRTVRHLVVTFGTDGALHVDRTDEQPAYRLVFDPANLEGDWTQTQGGQAFGYHSCLACAIVRQLIVSPQSPPIERGVMAGLAAMRRLHACGHGPVNEAPRVPLREVVEEMRSPTWRYAAVEVPESAPAAAGPAWTILGSRRQSASSRPLFGIARRVALHGASALQGVPYQRFGALLTVDRHEIEAFRNLQQLIRGYRDHDPGKKPLSIAVFGPPGSGKSFGVRELTRGVLGKDLPLLEFNLSQFSGPADLIGALHVVRDKVLEAPLPLVFWDEFDCQGYDWLQRLLAPMQDGRFQEGQVIHPIGKCIFVFAGGTSADFENFGPRIEDKGPFQDWQLKKGPDFKSRLSGYLNVLGPNRRQVFDPASRTSSADPSDVWFPIRRALLLRGLLRKRERELLSIDRGLLSALLEVGTYKHGARSMEKIVQQLHDRGVRGVLRRSDLPPAELTSMHVDYEAFVEIINRDLAFQASADVIAPAVHEYYLDLARREGWTPKYSQPYEELPDEIQADNRAAAARIPEVLALAGLYVVPKEGTSSSATRESPEEIAAILEENIELLAEAEHDGWVEYKQRNGWRLGSPRNDDARIHDMLDRYRQLNSTARNKDRNSVRSYPAILAPIGYRITGDPGS